jgi:hypothetical protein
MWQTGESREHTVVVVMMHIFVVKVFEVHVVEQAAQ